MIQDIKRILMILLKDCLEFTDEYFHAGLLTGGVSVFLYFMIVICRSFFDERISGKKVVRKCWRLPFLALLGFYCHLVTGITILSRKKGTNPILHLIPFSTWGTDSRHLTLWIENILMLVPLGILLYILWRPFRKFGWSMLAGFSCSLTIECIQFFGRLGKFEVDDIMNNVSGMLLGFCLCKGIDRIIRHGRC